MVSETAHALKANAMKIRFQLSALAALAGLFAPLAPASAPAILDSAAIIPASAKTILTPAAVFPADFKLRMKNAKPQSRKQF